MSQRTITPDTTLYCIGGGLPTDPRMSLHYDGIVELAQRRQLHSPVRIAFLPTARRNGTSPRLSPWRNVVQQFVARGCEVTEIYIGDTLPGRSETTKDEVSEILARSDGLYVAGGDTRYLLEVIRSRGLADVFLDAIESGLVASGSSAGTLWLADMGMSDSESFTCEGDWEFIVVRGLGLLPFVVNVHDDIGSCVGCARKDSRRTQFEDLFRSLEGPVVGLTIDEYVALEVRDGRAVVRSGSPEKGVCLLRNSAEGLQRSRVDAEFDLKGA